MITTHDVIRGMALRLSDEMSHIPPEELQKDAKQEYLNAEARFNETLKAIDGKAVAENVKQAAMCMVYFTVICMLKMASAWECGSWPNRYSGRKKKKGGRFENPHQTPHRHQKTHTEKESQRTTKDNKQNTRVLVS